jgi:hypothetical protein
MRRVQRDVARPVLAKARRETRRREGECKGATRDGGAMVGRADGEAGGRVPGAISEIVGAFDVEVARSAAAR